MSRIRPKKKKNDSQAQKARRLADSGHGEFQRQTAGPSGHDEGVGPPGLQGPEHHAGLGLAAGILLAIRRQCVYMYTLQAKAKPKNNYW